MMSERESTMELEVNPYDRLMEKHGITTEALVQCAEEMMK